MRRRGEAGFTLIEMIVVTAIVVIVVGTIGTLFLAGASPAVASAGRDVGAAFDEARRTAIAFDAATVVFAPAQSGSGYRARVYARMPGDPAFAARNGPTYDSTVAISETAAPLGAPGFAFAIDSHGTVTGFANFVAGQTNGTTHPCPASGAFALRLVYATDVRTVMIPCQLPLSSSTPVAFETPPQAPSAMPLPTATCPGTETCTLALLAPPPAWCQPGYTADATTAGECDVVATPTPSAPSTCPSGFVGQPPVCSTTATNPTPTPTAPSGCVAGAPDPLGFSSCLESDPIRITGNAVTQQGCGTHTPIADPGGRFSVGVEVWKDGAPWGSYSIDVVESKAVWLDAAFHPPAQVCGLLYSLAFSIATITPESGNATSTPWQDTGDDPAFLHDGIDAILFAPAGIWGTNT
jgi:prepilin-type N-terminal cleavage/methylation domain-containing protein